MGKANSKWNYVLLSALVFMAVCMASVSFTTYAKEVQPETEEENPIYDRLKDRMESAWEEGMERIEETNPIEISGNLVERLLRGIAAGLYRNLRNIKAGSLFAGGLSFLFGIILALLASKDKKIRKMAIGVCMCTIPAILLVFVFGVSWYISFFR